jgi:hypothetical protein
MDEVDTFFEVLFARKESNRIGSTGGKTLRSCPLPTYRIERVKEPWGPQMSSHVQ